jgi:hypothetical protein
MREHPIPQDIVGYRFHIVGNMTIKQFAEIGVGVFVAFLIYQTNLVAILKWPLMGLSVAVGAALAFVPFEERPLDHWLITFIRVLYKPTKFYWKRDNPIPDLFTYQVKKSTKEQQMEIDLSPARRERIKEYMLSIRQKQFTSFDEEREQSISTIMNTFSEVSGQITQLDKPQLKVRIRNLGVDTDPEPQLETAEAIIVEEQVVATGLAESSDYQEQLRQSINLRTPLSVNQVAQEIAIPEQQLLSVSKPQAAAEENTVVAEQPATNDQVYIENTLPTEQAQDLSLAGAVYNQQLPFPSKPDIANKLVGMVLTPNNELINDAIVEIKNQSGSTVRAVKTNALGQFFVTTPLADGAYTIETEKDGFQFSDFTLQLAGKVVDPIEIRSIV